MYLDKEEEKMLQGEYGEAVRKAMILLVRLGDVYGAEKMVEIGSAQAAGVSFKSIGDPGLEFLEGFAKERAKVRVPTFCNPAGMDLDRWKEMGISSNFAEKQKRIMKAFEDMGVILTSSCTPYLWGNLPVRGEHLAWSESSAVSFANSVIGAKTNREGGPSALAAGICGRTPFYGLHLDENRKSNLLVKVEVPLKTYADFGALGNYVGKMVGGGIPLFRGIQGNSDHLKALGAAMAASGAVALYFVEGMTCEKMNTDSLEKISVGDKELKETYENLNTGEDPDLIVFGCPHSSIREIAEIAEKIKGKKLKKDLWVCTSRAIKSWSDRMDYTKIIEEAGGKIICDTCQVVCPLEDLGYKITGVNSGKAAQYLPGFCKQKIVFGDTDKLIKMGCK